MVFHLKGPRVCNTGRGSMPQPNTNHQSSHFPRFSASLEFPHIPSTSRRFPRIQEA